MDKPNDAQLPRQRARTKGREDFFPTSLYEYDGSGITKKEWMATQLLAGMLPLGGGYQEDFLVETAVNLATKLLIRLVETDGIDCCHPASRFLFRRTSTPPTWEMRRRMTRPTLTSGTRKTSATQTKSLSK